VRESHIDPDDAAIATAIIGMAKGLGIGVTAEGVENEEQLAFLKQAGCQIVQGYYFGTPLPADELAKLVRQVRQTRFRRPPLDRPAIRAQLRPQPA
jgi:EAL domain-containing protein (putative c-di-GMP-specific phosphodiesterase class I)